MINKKNKKSGSGITPKARRKVPTGKLLGSDKTPPKMTRLDLFFTHYFVIGIAFVLILGLAVVLKITYEKVRDISDQTLKHEVTQMSDTMLNFRNFYGKVILPKVKRQGMVVSHDYKHKKNTLPLPATFIKDFSSYITPKQDEFSVRLYSDKPFSWRKEKELDAFEKFALNSLRKNPQQPVYSLDSMNGRKVLRYARADVMKPGCVKCHNNYPGSAKKNWKVGDVRGVLEVSRPVGNFLENTEIALKNAFLMMLAIILSIISLLFVVIRKMSRSIKLAHQSIAASERDNSKLVEEIRKRKQISHALKSSELKTRAIVNSVGEVIVVINKSGIVQECNEAIKKIFGYQPSDVIGNNISMLMTEKHAALHDAYLEKYVKSGKKNIMGKRRELYAKRRNGEIFPIELSVNDTQVGDEIVFTGTIRDITHRRKTQLATEAAHKAALESAQLKSDFLANMSHEIRTPMNGVLGMTQMLLESRLNKEQRSLAETVKESAESLLVIINDVLDFSKIEAGKLDIKNSRFKLLPIIEAVIELVDRATDKKYLDIAFFVDARVPEIIYSDSGRLRQILINLLNNALKFTDYGHVTLHISMDNNNLLRFEVRDTGPGIPVDQQHTLFDSFSQIDSSSTREHGGTGLGLAICKQLTGLLGGNIGVQSMPGAGSTFWFTIKNNVSDTANNTSINNNAMDKKTAKNRTLNEYIHADIQVLMMCSAHMLHQYYEKQMKQWGMQPDMVATLNQFLSHLEHHQYDMLVLDADAIYADVDHPIGITSILDTIREKTSMQIVLTARSEQYAKLEQLQLGVNVRMIEKPIKYTAIKLLLEKFTPDRKNNTASSKRREITQEGKLLHKNQLSEHSGAEPPKQKYHILLAEDNRVNQKVATVILQKLGYKSTLVANGKEALDAVNKEIFDLVLMDCQMPEMDGYEASRTIRKFPASHVNSNIPIIAFTANAMIDDVAKCKKAGMDDYLSKPIDIDELKKLLKKWRLTMDRRRIKRLALKAKEKVAV